jgi:hypothetical protein
MFSNSTTVFSFFIAICIPLCGNRSGAVHRTSDPIALALRKGFFAIGDFTHRWLIAARLVVNICERIAVL